MALISTGTGADKLAAGTTVQRPTATLSDAGLIRFNSDLLQLEQWDGTQWGSIGGGVEVGDIPPTIVQNGDLWYNSNDGRLYVYYTDANSSQWVDASPDNTAESGGGANVAVSDSPPGVPEEGDLWYSTGGAGAGRLYVYYQDGSSNQWVDVSPSEELDVSGFVSKSGDNMTGNLTLATNAITLETGGRGTFGSGNILLNADGSSVFKGSYMDIGDGLYQNPGTGGTFIWGNDATSSGGGFFVYKSTLDTVNINSSALTVLSAADASSTKTARFQARADGSVVIGTDTNDTASTNITLGADGSGTFKNNILVSESAWANDSNPGVIVDVFTGGTAQAIKNPSSYTGDVFSIFRNGLGQAYGAFTINADGTTKIGGTQPTSPNIALNANGTSVFQSTLTIENAGVGQIALNTTPTGGDIYCRNSNGDIQIDINGAGDVSGNVSFIHVGGTGLATTSVVPNAEINADGSSVYRFTPGGPTGASHALTIEQTAVTGGASFRSSNAAAGSNGTWHFYGDANSTAFSGWATNGSIYINGGAGSSGTISNSAVKFLADGSGQMNGTLTQNASDIKFKDNVTDAPSQSADIKALQLRTWDWNDIAPGTEARKARHTMGLVAQEAALVDADITYTANEDAEDADTQFQAIDHDVLTMKLVGALQEALAKIDDLEARLDAAGV